MPLNEGGRRERLCVELVYLPALGDQDLGPL